MWNFSKARDASFPLTSRKTFVSARAEEVRDRNVKTRVTPQVSRNEEIGFTAYA